ncbi:NAD(P)H-dependent oxidoreductase [Saccharibacillus alkalitolerans]|uniref:NAD(P)H-dependent oxidoreductase n=1 Tax=Saccharibacillus alkalitolerans TaxID=2705290 RepID=A0ABX0F9Q4_9BACL|nr:NAD(P)H-dependent oxidoreductase [Saccharibacillus alkalitolerans]NGZ77053.1 NAD(P)H-dependent oxidoreductase [Saccharibacillus alkalitolerans]
MNRTLVILAHPNLETSRVNRRWREELLRHPEQIELHDLYARYPDGRIDVRREQEQLERYDRVILQFPLYWYSYPPLLKKWFDDVFAYGWAYGSTGGKLKGKVLGTAISIGDKRLNYLPEGGVAYTVDEILAPFKASLRHVGAIELPYFALFGASFQASDEEVEQSAKAYVRHVLGEAL